MPHDVSLIATLAAGFALAMLFGYAAQRLRMPPLVGYLVAGILIGPATPGFVADVGLAAQLAEIGVMLLMFGVGLHFSIDDLVAVRRIAVPGALVQIGVAVLLGAGTATLWGWSAAESFVFGLCLSVASTVVLLRALEARGQLRTMNGEIAVGWLVVEDLVMVLVLVLLPAFAGAMGAAGSATADPAGFPWERIGFTLLKVGAFIGLMLVVGKRVLPRLLWAVARTGSRELFTLCVVAVAIGVAFGAAKLFDVSFALGAFFAGSMMRESEFSHRAADESLPLQDAFAVLFFVSVGMLFDPSVVIEQPGKVAAVVAIIMVGKTVAAIAIVLAFRYPLNTALTVGASLAQIGEFSFILAALGASLGVLPPEAQSLVLAGALISIAANSATFAVNEPVRRWIMARSDRARELDQVHDPLSRLAVDAGTPAPQGHAVLIGHGGVGAPVAAALRANGLPVVVVESNRSIVEALRALGVQAVAGNGADATVLAEAGIARAAMLIVTVPGPVDLRGCVELARSANPGIAVVARTHDEEEAELLRPSGVEAVFIGEQELARAITTHVTGRLSAARTGAMLGPCRGESSP
jgi:CPA2 family monovalent cation:H+ antiporter-2